MPPAPTAISRCAARLIRIRSLRSATWTALPGARPARAGAIAMPWGPRRRAPASRAGAGRGGAAGGTGEAVVPADKAGDKRGPRPIKHRARRCQLLDAAGVHDDD